MNMTNFNAVAGWLREHQMAHSFVAGKAGGATDGAALVIYTESAPVHVPVKVVHEGIEAVRAHLKQVIIERANTQAGYYESMARAQRNKARVLQENTNVHDDALLASLT